MILEATQATGISGEQVITAARYLGAGLSIGLGAIGAGAGEGVAAGIACQAIARNPEQYGTIFRTMIIGMAIAESTTIYALVISILLLFVVK
ncbi:ATP synthase F0 subunit C [Candidatus Acetothermia bacterium]|nr:ATP synthase F0 subunit C [Candidatus Acetothermia bacterium]MBI3461123.1 ATP synthase F0 subunit C [Candidatus Acetothermia bacterium]MBI3660117.1 ATP synthase F0 subunit C [Candidatus Acetothermia bacterium]